MIGGLLKKILGDKSVKDRKTYQPIIDKVNEIYATIHDISDDELRARTKMFQDKIKEGTAEIEKEIQTLKDQANHPDTIVLDKENIFEKIDKLTEELDKQLEVVLLENMPACFSYIKEIARRWAVKKKIVGNGNDFVIELVKTLSGF